MTSPNWDDLKAEILSRLDIRAEYELMNVKLVGGPNSSGWISCLNPYKPETNPSCGVNVGGSSYRGWFVAFNMDGSARGKPVSFWDMVRDWHPDLWGCEFKVIFKHMAKKAGVNIGGEPPPTPDHVQAYQRSITAEVRDYLHTRRGLSDDSVLKFGIGWDPKRERVAFPVYDITGDLVNIRFHAWAAGQKPKTLGWKGFNEKRLWGLERLAKAPKPSTVAVTEGEFDAMLLEQETGLLAVSPTNGKEGFDLDWVRHFHGHHVVLVWDCDREGRDAVRTKILPMFKGAVSRGEVLSIKVVWLFDQVDKDLKDFTDFIVKAGGSGQALHERIAQAAAEVFQTPTVTLPEPIVLESLNQIDDAQYQGKRVTVPLYIYGENTEAYASPSKIFVGECPRKKKGCPGRGDWAWSCDEPIPVQTGDRVMLACVEASDLRLESALRKWVCNKGQQPVITIDPENRVTIREHYAHQVISNGSETEILEKAVYVVGGKVWDIGQHQATGFIHARPRDQKPTLLIDTMEPQKEDWQAFDLERSRPLLRQIAALDLFGNDMIGELANHTRIYERPHLHLGVLLTLCSPRWIDFPSEGRIRGWISSVVIGDSGTGKTTTIEGIANLAGVGSYLSGTNSKRTGITYSISHDEKRGWRVKAGAIVKMNGQFLLVDEAQDVPKEDLKTLADAIDRGRIRVDKVQSGEYSAETRCIFSCNPKDPNSSSDQKNMSVFPLGCLAIRDVFPKMMIRRLDLVLYVSSSDLPKSVINKPRPRNKKNGVVTRENFRALIHYAWNLPPERILISDEVADYIRAKALELAECFGNCEDLPIVYPEDFRKNFCRMCVAAAVIDLSSSDDFETITVKQMHVDFMAMWVDFFYSAPNCLLDLYSAQYASENILQDASNLRDRLKVHIEAAPERRDRISTIIAELRKIDVSNPRQKLQQGYISDYLGVSRMTIFSDMKLLLDEDLVKSERGYRPTTKLSKLVFWLRKHDRDLINLSD